VPVAVDIGTEIRQHVVFVSGAIPDEVVAAFTGPRRVRESRDGIAEHVLAFGEVEAEPGKEVLVNRGGQRALVRKSAPGDVPCVPRSRVRLEPGTHARADPVRTDEELRFMRGAVCESCDDAAGCLFQPLERMAEVIALGGKRGAQELVKAAPGRQALPDGERAQDATIASKRNALGYVDAEAFVDRNADSSEAREEIRMRDDACAPGDETFT
jgi:hypothetical protein